MKGPPKKDLPHPHQPKGEQTAEEHEPGVGPIGTFFGVKQQGLQLIQIPTTAGIGRAILVDDL